MTVLIISPDYVSHYLPLSVLANAALLSGERVVVATGPGLRSRVIEEGFEWRSLRLGPASNSGIVADDPATRNFLAATANGPLATIRYQAEQRLRDLLWEPEQIIAEVGALLQELDPLTVIVDHVSFGSTLAMYASGRPFITVVPGHPSQLPVGRERYGIPAAWPLTMQPNPTELADVEQLADQVTHKFTARWNQALTTSESNRLSAGRLFADRPSADRPSVDDAFQVQGHRVLFNSVAELGDANRQPLLPADHRFVGPLVRSEVLPGEFRQWAEPTGENHPRVYVALGTFLSHRVDVLATIADGLREFGARAAIATGPSRPDALGPVPDDWIVAPSLPQVGLLADADIIIHHGGNNSAQEALASGTRQIVLPFSTDQFANASDLERSHASPVCAPNQVDALGIAAALEQAWSQPKPTKAQPLNPSELCTAMFS